MQIKKMTAELRYASSSCLFSSVCYRLTKPRHSYMSHVAELSNAGHPQMLKERSSKSACASGKVFELLPPGRLAAERIRYNRWGEKN